MKTKIKSFIIKLLIGLSVVATNVSSYYIGSFIKNGQWKQELLDRNLAEYNVKTGEWQYAPTGDLFGLPTNK